MSTAAITPREFIDLIKAIGESKSKQEEDRIISEEVVYLKKAIPQQNVPKKKMKELIIRSLYVEMLGQDASFAYIKAVEMCASTNISQKKIGYLAASLCLSPDHEFRFMLVNQIQRDMKSANLLEVCSALTAVCKIVTEDMIPAVVGEVVKLVRHESEVVRKHAVCAMHRLYQMDKTSISDHLMKLRTALCDKDPCVMGSCLPLFQVMIQDDVHLFKDLVPSFVIILKQITEHRLPREYDYHRIPAPWLQMNLLRILGLLGRGDQASSEGMYEVLVDVMRRADTGINVGYAIVYEAVKTVTSIYPNTLLLDAAATSISRFIRSDSHNLKYIGIKGLASIVKDHPRYAADHQMAVIDCLEDPDETLKRKTLDLLFRMTNAVNVEFIVEKLLSFLATTLDDHFRTDLVGQITQCAERFAPSNSWYVQTIVKVFELAGDKVKSTVAQTLTQLIAEGAAEEEEGDGENLDDELRTEAVEAFLALIGKPKLPEILAQCMAWVLGEYGYLSSSCTKEEIMDKLYQLAYQTADPITKAQVITALMKLVAQSGSCPDKVLNLINLFSQSVSLDVQQRCIEFQSLLLHSNVMVDVLPVDASCEDLEVDENLNFLNGFVQQALANGAKPYTPPQVYEDDDDEIDSKKMGLKMTPYEMPQIPAAQPSSAILHSAPIIPSTVTAQVSGVTSPQAVNQTAPQNMLNVAPNLNTFAGQGNQLLNTRGSSQVWGRKPDPPAAPIPVVATPISNPPPTPVVVDTNTNVYSTPAQVQNVSPMAVSKSNEQTPLPPPAPRQLTEKEKMAASLFGGVGGNAGVARSNSKATKRTSQTSTTPVAPPVVPSVGVPTNNAIDLLLSPVPPTPPVLTTTSTNGVLPEPPLMQTTKNTQPVNHLLDFDLLSAPVPHSVPTSVMPTNLLSPSNALNTPTAVFPSMSTQSSLSPSTTSNTNNISNAFSDMLINDLTTPSSSLGSLSNGSNYATDSGVRPLPINTGEFGKRWGITNFDAKQSVPCGIVSLPQLRTVMPSSYHHVESIENTSEAIYAATLTSNGSIILVHTKLQISRRVCDVVVKSTSKDVCSRELMNIVNSIGSFRA